MDILLATVIFGVSVILFFVAVYFLLRQNFRNQQRIELMRRARSSGGDTTQRLKLQAYERLMLFCERIEVRNLLLRLQSSKMSSSDLRAAIVVAVQREFEHNLSQQLYVSDQLWQIIDLAKNQVIEIVTHVASGVPDDAGADKLAVELLNFVNTQEKNPVSTAKAAIKKESGLLLQ